jgi:hypothetical protein
MTTHAIVPDARHDFDDERTQPGASGGMDASAALFRARLATQGRINDLHDAIARGYMFEVADAATQLALACFSLSGAVWAVRAEPPERQDPLRASLDEVVRLRGRIAALFARCASARVAAMDSPVLQDLLARCASSIERVLARATILRGASGS